MDSQAILKLKDSCVDDFNVFWRSSNNIAAPVIGDDNDDNDNLDNDDV